VRCRDCGAKGVESDDDLMPNTCPACFERRVFPCFFGPPIARDHAELRARLIAAGCEPTRITAYIDQLEREYERLEREYER
jgi:hypothetical protein